MAKKFNLAELMGETVSKSDTGEMRVQEIALTEIEENAANTYTQTGIDELAESIEVIGLQQPLVVRRKPGPRNFRFSEHFSLCLYLRW